MKTAFCRTISGLLVCLCLSPAVAPNRNKILTIADGLPDSTITGIGQDRVGFVWISTADGLARYDGRNIRVFRHEEQPNSLAENNILRFQNLSDGTFLLQTRTGDFQRFDPATIRTDTYDPPVVLTSLKINHSPVNVNQADSPLSVPINALSELILNHTQNFLTFEFAGLQYNKPEKLTYRYRLTGVDQNWVNAGTQNMANYTQLAPGTYSFEVNSTNADGKWSPHIKRLAVLVRPPYWATWWAYMLYAVVFGGLVFSFIRLRSNRIREQQEVALHHQEAEQLRAVDEVKTRFFANITHEFRTPLSLILSPIEKLLLENKHDDPTRLALISVQRNANQLLRLINQLLDLSKLEAGNTPLLLAQGEVAEFVEQIVDSFRPLADQKGVILDFGANKLVDEHLFEADKWEKIIANLLSNALKFTPQGGRMHIDQRALRDYNQRQLLSVDTTIQLTQVEDTFLKTTYTYIDSRLDDSSLTVDELAGIHSISRRTLHRKLIALTNLSANDLIRQYRLRRAAELLREGHSVAETAYCVGFDNPGYFSTIFKRMYQQTPTEFAAQ